MRFAFAKNGQSLVPKLIAFWTRGPYFHVEAIFSDNTSFGALPVGSMKTEYQKDKVYDPKYWDFVDIPCTLEQEIELRKWCDTEVGCKYDWYGIIFSQVLGMRREHPTQWFCSEICVAMLQKLGYFMSKTPCTISPNKLYKMIFKGDFK